jgi:hypothetical protein
MFFYHSLSYCCIFVVCPPMAPKCLCYLAHLPVSEAASPSLPKQWDDLIFHWIAIFSVRFLFCHIKGNWLRIHAESPRSGVTEWSQMTPTLFKNHLAASRLSHLAIRAEHHVCIYRYMGCRNMGPVPIPSGLQEPLWQDGWWASHPPYQAIRWWLYTGHMTPVWWAWSVVPGASPHVLASHPPHLSLVTTWSTPFLYQNKTWALIALQSSQLKSHGLPMIIGWCH